MIVFVSLSSAGLTLARQPYFRRYAAPQRHLSSATAKAKKYTLFYPAYSATLVNYSTLR